jgi:hypothetical protein
VVREDGWSSNSNLGRQTVARTRTARSEVLIEPVELPEWARSQRHQVARNVQFPNSSIGGQRTEMGRKWPSEVVENP